MENVEENVNRPRDTEENVKETISKVSQSAHRAVDKMTDMGYQTTEVLGEKGEQLMSAEAEMIENYREYIRNYPMRSVGIAVAAGFFLSRLLR
ncbi:MAG: hypothetical protein M0R47_01545 [Methylobacter sp.]|jgi:ElaB/YqjD/DUF883 family membrane-anchored ribosome-binding protein|uniref:hypothetical protein n=1 Tax=Methylobacter sp. TaxID=2051955 RepID=UPI0025DDFBE7|nr:hypothetical protein [Methylobacter sp.]MCK9619199.1 hypothetical protein [Methylobacter sp.]